jgi:hypothetical protein
LNAIHDWNGSPDSIDQGQKAMLVLLWLFREDIVQ